MHSHTALPASFALRRARVRPATVGPTATLLALSSLALLVGCASTPADNAALADARSRLSATQADARSAQLAPTELRQASEAVALAEAAWTRRDSPALVDQLAYLATQKVGIADATTRQKIAEASSAGATAERDRLRLAARTIEADTAQRAAALAQQSAVAAQGRTDAAERQGEAAQRDALAARQSSRDSELRAQELERQVKELKARKTERGLVVTLGDVLFDNNRAELRSGAARSIDQLATFLKQYPLRKARVEGFTDSVGPDASNQVLSESRAAAVRMALLARGIGPDRVSMQGYGEAHPVSDNGSTEGRQANRRVEIVLSDDNGSIAAR